MSKSKDIRWEQRFISFNKAFKQLERFLKVTELNELERQGLIKAFEYTYELSWKTLQDLLKHKGYDEITGPKPVIEQCFQDGIIEDGKGWIRMHKSRNLASHTYNEDTANDVIKGIRKEYFKLFQVLQARLEEERSGKQSKLYSEQ